MKKLFVATIAVLALLSATAKDYVVSTPKTMLVLTAETDKPLYFRYYGSRASLTDVFSSHRAMKEQAYRAFGTNCVKPVGSIVKFSDGDNCVNMKVKDVAEKEENGMKKLAVTLRDTAHPFEICLHYDAYQDCDIIKCWAEYINLDKKPMVLQKYMSMFLPVKSQDCALLHLNGDHGNECNENIEPLTEGIKVISTMEGSRCAAQNIAGFMLGTDGRIEETSGNVIGATLIWPGNFYFEFNNTRVDKEPIIVMGGINPTASDYTLDAKKTFTTPEMVLTYSTSGKGQITRNFHYWARHHQILHGQKLREILLNSWEGVHLNVTQEGMNSMMDEFSKLGGELFVMDDGWFGDKYPRDKDNTSLGDWCIAKKKLPEGVDGLVRYAKDRNLKFGIWIEPEMVNTKSELYEKHPDWVLRHDQFNPTYGRGKTQLLLDLTNPKVQDFVVGVVDQIMKNNPEIYYIKWDHNMSILNASSQYLPKSRQSNLYVDYQLGLYSILKRVREAYPDLVIQLCSSGGFRFNYAFMPYFQEVWGSDQTEALSRIYIQWGELDFFPSNIIAAHVCASRNKYTQRETPIKFRFDVASMCRLGMEMVPAHLTDAEKVYAKRAIAAYKKFRSVVQQGDLYKLVSPYEGNRDHAAVAYVDASKDRAIAMIYRLMYSRHMPDKIIKLQGLDPEKNYRITEVCPEIEGKPVELNNKVVSGRYLMEEGLVVKELYKGFSTQKPLNEIRNMNDFKSVILELRAE